MYILLYLSDYMNIFLSNCPLNSYNNSYLFRSAYVISTFIYLYLLLLLFCWLCWAYSIWSLNISMFSLTLFLFLHRFRYTLMFNSTSNFILVTSSMCSPSSKIFRSSLYFLYLMSPLYFSIIFKFWYIYLIEFALFTCSMKSR